MWSQEKNLWLGKRKPLQIMKLETAISNTVMDRFASCAEFETSLEFEQREETEIAFRLYERRDKTKIKMEIEIDITEYLRNGGELT